jgi:hypothetical protein
MFLKEKKAYLSKIAQLVPRSHKVIVGLFGACELALDLRDRLWVSVSPANENSLPKLGQKIPYLVS